MTVATGEDVIRVRVRVSRNDPAFRLLSTIDRMDPREHRAKILALLNFCAVVAEASLMTGPEFLTHAKTASKNVVPQEVATAKASAAKKPSPSLTVDKKTMSFALREADNIGF